MNAESVIQILQSRTCDALFVEETEQIKDLCQIYDPYFVGIAARFSEEATISSMVVSLIRLCGFPTEVPPDLKWILPSRSDAVQFHSPEYIEICDRLQEITVPLTDEQISKLTSPNGQTSPYTAWMSQTGRPLSANEREVLDRTVYQYGIAITLRGVRLIGLINDQAESTRIAIYQQWVEAAVKGRYGELEMIVKSVGGSEAEINWSLPGIFPRILYLYFQAKVSDDCCGDFNQLIQLSYSSSIEEVIYSMSLVPFWEFTVTAIVKTYFIWKKNGHGLAKFAYDNEDKIGYCEKCNQYLNLEKEQWWLSREDSTSDCCPECSQTVENHDIVISLDHIKAKYGPLIPDFDYELMKDRFSVQYCRRCGHFVQDNQDDYYRYNEYWGDATGTNSYTPADEDFFPKRKNDLEDNSTPETDNLSDLDEIPF